ncbi:pseudouridine synthase [Streptomyces sp. NPDC093085]|uniref:pseudouridine synthase n=1 Tax=Streptomyces sp. NPDC093085 TaxID=3155068 RepID=UPI003423A36A
MVRRHPAPPPSPLPQRDGVDPVRLRLPHTDGTGGTAGADGTWPTVRAYLVARYGGAVGAERVAAMVREGRFHGEHGPVGAEEPYAAGRYVWFHRDPVPEERVPFEIGIVYRDERIVVADKPHFLATTPRGGHVTETAQARLRRDLALPELQPAHRLDRLTAGLVLFVVRARDRGAYQRLFAERRVRKEYEGVAPYDPAVPLPVTVRGRIEKERGVLAAREAAGEPNAESRIELLEHRGGYGRYRLVPVTGRTHQLRVHMCGLGLPLLDDPVYPVVQEPTTAGAGGSGGPGGEDYGRPLQLLARVLEFTDPLTGAERRFESRLRLAPLPPAR